MFSFSSWLSVETVDRDEDKLTREDLEKEVRDGNNVPSDFFILLPQKVGTVGAIYYSRCSITKYGSDMIVSCVDSPCYCEGLQI